MLSDTCYVYVLMLSDTRKNCIFYVRVEIGKLNNSGLPKVKGA